MPDHTDALRLAREALDDAAEQQDAHTGFVSREPVLARAVIALVEENERLRERVATLRREVDEHRERDCITPLPPEENPDA